MSETQTLRPCNACTLQACNAAMYTSGAVGLRGNNYTPEQLVVLTVNSAHFGKSTSLIHIILEYDGPCKSHHVISSHSNLSHSSKEVSMAT